MTSTIEMFSHEETYTGDRLDGDYYPTPPELVDALLHYSTIIGPKRGVYPARRVLEPCAGRALRIAEIMREAGHEVFTADIDPHAPVDLHASVITHDWGQHGVWDWVITNPPYQTAELHAADVVDEMLKHCRFGAFLLRLSFQEPCQNRLKLILENPPVEIIVMPRVSFRGSGSDNTTTAWFVWAGEHTMRIPVYRRMPTRWRSADPAWVDAARARRKGVA